MSQRKNPDELRPLVRSKGSAIAAIVIHLYPGPWVCGRASPIISKTGIIIMVIWNFPSTNPKSVEALDSHVQKVKIIHV